MGTFTLVQVQLTNSNTNSLDYHTNHHAHALRVRPLTLPPAMPAATRLCPPSKRHHASFSLYTRSTSLAAPEATPPSHGETPTPLTTTFSPIWYLAVRMR